MKEHFLHLPSAPNLHIAIAGGGLALAARPADGREHWTLVPVNVPGGAAILATRNLSSLNSTAR